LSKDIKNLQFSGFLVQRQTVQLEKKDLHHRKNSKKIRILISEFIL